MNRGDDQLQRLLGHFVDGEYAAEGTEIEDGEGERPGHPHHDHHHGGDAQGQAGASVREFEHRGHRVRIATHYEVTIDGKPWSRPLEVLPDGSVTFHDLPQYVVPSAVDIVRAVIDQSYEAPREIRAVVEAAREEE